MEQMETEKSPLEQAARNLFDFAVDRRDIKQMTASLHPQADIDRNSVEYELPLLKIITVGWSISYFINHPPYKNAVAETYWSAVREFAAGLSETAGLLTGKDIDYFQVIKNRLDIYVNAMNRQPEASEPAVVIGPEFANACGNREDVFTVMTGARMFIATAGSVKSYLEEAKLR
jgi:hypothetical protein